MIFGKTHAQRRRAEQLDAIRKIHGIKKFAWRPVKLTSGQYAWLVPYYEYYYWECQWDNQVSPPQIADLWVVTHGPHSPTFRRELTHSAANVWLPSTVAAGELASYIEWVRSDVG